MSQPLTQGLAQFAVNSAAAVPPDVVPMLRNAFIDTLAVLMSGRQEPVTRAALAFAGRRQGDPQASVLLEARRLHVADAAFVNGVSAHALDYDDMALNGHPSVVLVPALLAQAEALGASDAALLRAYLVGYEVWAELARREPDPLHTKGWHPTSVLGTVAAAAAVAQLMQLDVRQATHALGIAASMSCGLVGNFGSMTKPLHAGWAAAHAIEAAHLAHAGTTAGADVLASPAGFLAAFSPRGNAERGSWSPPKELHIRTNGLSIKKYPVCYATHRVIDGVLDLRARCSLDPAQITHIDATVSDVSARVLHNHRPATGLEAKFSMEFACAMAACEGAVGLAQVTDDQVRRDDMQELMSRVRVHTVAAGCPMEPSFALHDQVVLHLADGRVLDSGPIRFARGHARKPLPAAELDAKFRSCVAHTAHTELRAAEQLLDTLHTMSDQPEPSLLRALERFAR